MKRRICTLLVLVLVLCGGIACAQRAVPDFCAFSQGLVHERTDKKHEDTKDSLRRYYEGTSDNIELAVQEYIQLLQDAYGFRLTDSYEIPQANGFDYIIFGLQSEQPEDDAIHFSVNSSAQGWEIDNCDVFVQYWKYLGGDRQGVTCYINNEYVFEESGDYAKQALTKPGNATAASAPASGIQSCSTCGGDGKITKSCTSCSGDGSVWENCMTCGGKGKESCMYCFGRGNDHCFSCSGKGRTRCSSCGGSGLRTGQSLCSICGGDGENYCSPCNGTGRERCSSCSGSGSKSCSYCSGLGKRSRSCSSCGGDRELESDCSACGGGRKDEFGELGDYSQQVLTKNSNATEVPMVTAASTPEGNTQPCSSCGADGKITQYCTTCGGDKKVSTELICNPCSGKGERNCYACKGIGYEVCGPCYGIGWTKCMPCFGSGLVDDHSTTDLFDKKLCSHCWGEGKLTHDFCAGTGKISCTTCDGNGSEECWYCHGTGHRQVECTSCNGSGMEHNDCTDCGGDGRI